MPTNAEFVKHRVPEVHAITKWEGGCSAISSVSHFTHLVGSIDGVGRQLEGFVIPGGTSFEHVERNNGLPRTHICLTLRSILSRRPPWTLPPSDALPQDTEDGLRTFENNVIPTLREEKTLELGTSAMHESHKMLRA